MTPLEQSCLSRRAREAAELRMEVGDQRAHSLAYWEDQFAARLNLGQIDWDLREAPTEWDDAGCSYKAVYLCQQHEFDEGLVNAAPDTQEVMWEALNNVLGRIGATADMGQGVHTRDIDVIRYEDDEPDEPPFPVSVEYYFGARFRVERWRGLEFRVFDAEKVDKSGKARKVKTYLTLQGVEKFLEKERINYVDCDTDEATCR